MTKEQLFWDWFLANEERLRTALSSGPGVVTALFSELIRELQRYCPGLSFQLGGIPGKQRRELFITSRGKKELFPAVEALVATAPGMEHWMVFAHLQPVGVHASVRIGDRKLEAKQTWFLPLESPGNREAVRIRIYVPAYRPEEAEIIRNTVQALLYALLGEKPVLCDLGEWELDDLANYNMERDGLRKLAELETFIRTKKQRVG